MIRRLLLLTTLIAVPSIASAASASITSPTPGSVIGARFTIIAASQDGCGIATATVTDAKGQSGTLPLVERDGKTVRQDGNQYVAEVDLNNPIKGKGDNAVYAAAGNLKINWKGSGSCRTEVTYEYQPPPVEDSYGINARRSRESAPQNDGPPWEVIAAAIAAAGVGAAVLWWRRSGQADRS